MSPLRPTKFSPEFIQNILTYLPVVIWALDKDGIFTLSEGAGLAKIGLRPGEAVGQSVYELYADYPEIINAAKRALAGQAVSVTSEVAGITFESRYAPLRNEKGALIGMLGIAMDVTERVHSERELTNYARRVTKANEALEEFVSTASHDLQEPVRNMITYLGLIEKEFGNKMDSTLKEYFNFTIQGASRMAALIRKLLSNTRPVAEGLDFTRVDCAEVLKHAEANLRWQIVESKAVIKAGSLPTVLGSEVQLIQVFQNLISNSIKFHGNKPPMIEINAQREGGEWIIGFKDHGDGFDPSAAQRIFSLYQRIQRSDEKPGTGIGLAIVRRIVEYHGGRIWTNSKTGEGATFFVSLPAV